MKYQITQQANGLYSVWTDTGQDSMADENLIDWDISEELVRELAKLGYQVN